MSKWTTKAVEARLEEAARTLRCLPDTKIQGYFTAWPQILHDAEDKREWEIYMTRPSPPSPQAISRMEETLTWFYWLKPEERRLIWLKANHASWKTICWRLGCARNTAWRHWVYALAKIANRLSGKQPFHKLILPISV